MTASDVNVVINNIASKLGLAASNMSDFVPELARYHIAQDAANVVVCMIVLFVLALAVRWFIKQNISDIFDDFAVASIGICGGIAGAIICVAAVVVLVDGVSDLAGWLASPAAAAVKSVLSAMGA